MSSDQALRKAAALMADRLRIYRITAQSAAAREDRVDLAPCELWEPSDQAALDAYEEALNKINGAQPLPMEIPA